MITIDLEGKTALVTGGSRGIGREISLKLAEAGCDIAVNYYKNRKKAEEVSGQIESSGKRSIVVKRYLIRKQKVRSGRLFLCKPKYDKREKKHPRVKLSL